MHPSSVSMQASELLCLGLEAIACEFSPNEVPLIEFKLNKVLKNDWLSHVAGRSS